MSLQQRGFFFQAMLDRLKNGDIPTEDTFRDLLDSVAFFRELSDTAQRARGGLVKTTPDSKVNARDNSDVLGASPLGFKTFVQPAQLWQLKAGSGITLTPVVRALPVGGADDSGVGIEDIEVSVNFPALPTIPSTTADLTTSAGITLDNLTGAFPYTVTPGTIAGGTTLQAALVAIAGEVNNLVAKADAIANEVRADQLDALATVELTVQQPTGPNAWGTKYLEPVGQLLAIASYPDLYAKIGVAFGGDGVTTFALPNWTADAYVRGMLTVNAGVGTMTGVTDYSLTVANIPEHDHTFSGTTDPDGQHSHDIQTADSVAGNLRVDGSAGAYNNTDTTAISTEPDHTHTFSGTTGVYGTNPVTPIPLTPTAINFYLKMRVLP